MHIPHVMLKVDRCITKCLQNDNLILSFLLVLQFNINPSVLLCDDQSNSSHLIQATKRNREVCELINFPGSRSGFLYCILNAWSHLENKF